MVDDKPRNADDEAKTPKNGSTRKSTDRQSPPEAAEAAEVPVSQEITLRDGEWVTVGAPTDGTAHIVVNVVQPPRSTGFFSSCLQGCGCLVLVIVILSAIGSLFR